MEWNVSPLFLGDWKASCHTLEVFSSQRGQPFPGSPVGWLERQITSVVVQEGQDGGAIRTESKLMLYVFYCIKWIFKKYRIPLEIYAIKTPIPWTSYSFDHYTTDDQMKMRATYKDLMESLHHLKGWLQSCYEQEATYEHRKLKELGGEIDDLNMARESEHKWLGNEKLYKPEAKAKMEVWYIPGGAKGNTEIRPSPSKEAETLQWHQHRQAESCEREIYRWSLDKEAPISPTNMLPSPQPRVVSPAPTVVGPTVMTIEEYRTCNEARHQHQLTHTLTYDENNKRLDYYCDKSLQETQPANRSSLLALEDEDCLEGDTLPCALSEENALLNPTFQSTMTALDCNT